MENIMEPSMWLILLIIAVPIFFVFSNKNSFGRFYEEWASRFDTTPPVQKEVKKEKSFKAPTAQKLMKFTKKELIEFANNNNIVVTPSKTKSEIIKQIRK
jgi:hypothetical protein